MYLSWPRRRPVARLARRAREDSINIRRAGPTPTGVQQATAHRVAARSRRDFVARLAKDQGHSLRHAPRRAIDLASNAAHERYIETP